MPLGKSSAPVRFAPQAVGDIPGRESHGESPWMVVALLYLKRLNTSRRLLDQF